MSDTEILSDSIEEYLKVIHRFSGKDQAPTTTRLAECLGVKPASVTGMLRRLAEMGLISYKRYGPIELTPLGERRAHAMIRRHRLAERLLSDMLEVPLEQVHDEACRLEHALSPEVATRIAEKLGDPADCPHGNPIDARVGDRTVSLLDAPLGRPLIIVRLDEESPSVVSYLTERALLPGAQVKVVAREPLSQGIVLEVADRKETIGRDLAATVRVKARRSLRKR